MSVDGCPTDNRIDMGAIGICDWTAEGSEPHNVVCKGYTSTTHSKGSVFVRSALVEMQVMESFTIVN